VTIQQLRSQVEQQKGKRAQVQADITTLTKRVKEHEVNLHRQEEAREVIRVVGQKTQAELEFRISDITSLALAAVYDNPYELKTEFVMRRNKTECDLLFVRDGERIDPLTASGGGAVDVAAFALRVASWSMARPRSANVMILDEPGKHIKGVDANRRVLELMQQISRRLRIQILMVADERIPREDLLERADRAFEVTIKKGISHVEQIS
jgi:DNA repair exonuclease SbcCD ATPase subunit